MKYYRLPQQLVLLPPDAGPQATTGPGTDFLTVARRSAREGHLVSLNSVDGTQKCTMPSPMNLGSATLLAYRQQDRGCVSLRDDFALHDFGRHGIADQDLGE